MVNRRNTFPVKTNDSICLIISSCFFLTPGCYAFVYSFHFYGFVSCITTIVSMNYWRYPVYGFRRTLDLITAKMSFCIYFISGCWFIRDFYVLIIGIPGCFLILFFYYLSNHYWERDSCLWVWFHMLFHLFVALEQSIVIYSGIEKHS